MKNKSLIIVAIFGLFILIAPAYVEATTVDLTIEKVELNPSNPQPGEKTMVTFWGKNIGSSNLTDGKGINNIAVSIEDFIIEGDQYSWMVGATPSPSVGNPLKPGDIFTYTYTGSFSSTGNKTLNLKVDNANELPELNENNNSFFRIIHILNVGDLIKTATNPAVYYYGSDKMV